MVRLEAQRENIEPLRRKNELERQQTELEASLAETARELLLQDQQLQRNLQASRSLSHLLASPSLAADIPQLTDLHSRHLADQPGTSERALDMDLSRFLQKDLTGDLASLEQDLQRARQLQRACNDLADHWRSAPPGQSTRRDQLADAHVTRRRHYESLTSQC